ncbi:MAG: hypothetical protein LBR15_08660 [Methanobrevibacter sp.]|jgi:mRNA-degrading endonuclease RelE of RelBE toxin-antitoxin system|nr:hypothetical protein [Candidatus Methanovirga australis]
MIKYDFDYHPKFLKECEDLFKHCPNFKSDFENFKDAINANLDMFNHNLPKKFIRVSNRGYNIKLPLFKYRYFYCKNGDGSKLRFIFLLHREQLLVYFTEVYHKNHKKDLDYKRVEVLFK